MTETQNCDFAIEQAYAEWEIERVQIKDGILLDDTTDRSLRIKIVRDDLKTQKHWAAATQNVVMVQGPADFSLNEPEFPPCLRKNSPRFASKRNSKQPVLSPQMKWSRATNDSAQSFRDPAAWTPGSSNVSFVTIPDGKSGTTALQITGGEASSTQVMCSSARFTEDRTNIRIQIGEEVLEWEESIISSAASQPLIPCSLQYR